MKKAVPALSFILVLFYGIAFSFGQNVSDEARRRFDRGRAAWEMKDFKAAIAEFAQAVKLAADWPDAVYNLGAAYEIAENYEEAIRCYREYLRLAPGAEDAEEVNTLINKLEFKAERKKTLTNADIAGIIAALGNEEIWYQDPQGWDKGIGLVLSSTTRQGDQGIRVPNMIVYVGDQGVYQVVEQESYKHINIDGPLVKFDIQNSHVGYPVLPPYVSTRQTFEIEVLSRDLVKVRSYIWLPNGEKADPGGHIMYRRIGSEKGDRAEIVGSGADKPSAGSTLKTEPERAPEISVEQRSTNGVLYYAASMGDQSAAEVFIGKGADINYHDTMYLGRTPLHVATAKHHGDMVGFLIVKGADVNAKDELGRSPLHLAATSGDTEIAGLLITRGAQIDAKDNEGKTALYLAVAEGKIEMTDLLIAKGADINAHSKQGNGWSPLHVATMRAGKDIVELLILRGAEIDIKDWDGNTPLHVAAYYGKREIAELLIAKGADAKVKDNAGKTPLDYALEMKRQDVADLLRKAGR